MTIEIEDLPIENGGSFHSYVNVYQRVHPLNKSYGKGQPSGPQGTTDFRFINFDYPYFAGENPSKYPN